MSQFNASNIPPLTPPSHYSHSISRNHMADPSRALISSQLNIKKEDTNAERTNVSPKTSLTQGQLAAAQILTGNPLSGAHDVTAGVKVEQSNKYFRPNSLISSHRLFTPENKFNHLREIASSSNNTLTQFLNGQYPVAPTENLTNESNLMGHHFQQSEHALSTEIYPNNNNQPPTFTTKVTIDLTNDDDDDDADADDGAGFSVGAGGDDEYDGRTHSLPHAKYGPYRCGRCNGVFEISQAFASHMRKHYMSDSKEETRRRLMARVNKRKRWSKVEPK